MFKCIMYVCIRMDVLCTKVRTGIAFSLLGRLFFGHCTKVALGRFGRHCKKFGISVLLVLPRSWQRSSMMAGEGIWGRRWQPSPEGYPGMLEGWSGERAQAYSPGIAGV